MQECVFAALKLAGVWELWLLLIIGYNVDHGPNDDQERRGSQRAAMGAIYEPRQPHDVPLYEAAAPDIVKSLEQHGIIQFARNELVEVELWKYLSGRTRSAPMGRCISLFRFGASQHGAGTRLPWWDADLFETSCLAIENDMLVGKKLTEEIKLAEKDKVALDKTKPLTTMEDRSLKATCKCVVTLKVMFWSDSFNRAAGQRLLVAQRPMDIFHT